MSTTNQPYEKKFVIVLSLLMTFLALTCLSESRAEASVRFNHQFAPEDGKTAPVEAPFRQEICMNGLWQFEPMPLPSSFHQNVGPAPDLPAPTPGGWDKTPIRIPSPWDVNAFPDRENLGGDFRTFPSYPESWEGVQMGWLHRQFFVPESWQGKRLFLHFDAVAGNASVVVNGTTVGSHFDIFLPFDVDVTAVVKYGAPNDLLVGVRKASLFDVQGKFGRRTYQGGSMWGQAIAGIWQDVFLEATPTVHISDVFIKPLVDQNQLSADVTVRNDGDSDQSISLSNAIFPWINKAGSGVISAPEPNWTLGKKGVLASAAVVASIPAHGQMTLTLSSAVNGALKFWSPKAPNLYGMVCTIDTSTGQRIDIKYTRFGWRQMTFDGNKTLLNGSPIVMHGDSWHFIGIPEMSRRYAWAWFTTLKTAHMNAVRLHAEPYPSFFLDVADEQGIMVLDEDAVWASDGGPNVDSSEFWSDTMNNLEGLILRDRNHPSVFGWSVSNEVMPVIKYVYHAPQEYSDELIKYDGLWAALCRKDDPTRPWISADGEGDGGGALPTEVQHYSGAGDMLAASKRDKPWGVGEAGPAYYGSPEQIDQMSGDANAYLSVLDRMEGVAVASYNNLADQNKYGADYRSVFNLVWYGLKPLNLGMSDTTKPPAITDGVFFPPFVEGKPGVQPERLGPYCTTLNPGYDSKLPLFDPWPLYYAMSDAAADPPIAYKPDRPFSPDANALKKQIPGTITAVHVLSGPDGKLSTALSHLGVDVATISDPADANLVFVDGASPPAADRKQEIDQILTAGGTVVVWGFDPATLQQLNGLLPEPIQLTSRTASSLAEVNDDVLTTGITPVKLYFAESNPSAIITEGIDGPLINKGKILIQATEVDWSRWNGHAELVKTASVLRSEREAKPRGVALCVLNVGTGRLVLCSITTDHQSPKAIALDRALLTNLNVNLADAAVSRELDREGNILSVLACGPFGMKTVAEALTINAVDPNDGASAVSGAAAGSRNWTAIAANPDNEFSLPNSDHDAGSGEVAHYLSFWINSPKSLNNLLLDPHMPVVDLHVDPADAAQVWVNAAPVTTSQQSGEILAHSLQLMKGWNHILVKTVRSAALLSSGLTLSLSSSQPEYLSQLRGDRETP